MRTIMLAIAAGAAVAGSAQAAFISFASDSAAQTPVFQGNGASVQQAGTGVAQTLLVDGDQNGPNAAFAIPVIFQMTATLSNFTPANSGGIWFHNHLLNGQFSFTNANTGANVLTVNFTNAAFTSVSGSPQQWSTSATIQGSVPTTQTAITGALAQEFGFLLTDFAFTITNLRPVGGGPGASVGVGANGQPTTAWTGEGSFSGTIVPSPGAMALLAGAGLFAARRRRAA